MNLSEQLQNNEGLLFRKFTWFSMTLWFLYLCLLVL